MKISFVCILKRKRGKRAAFAFRLRKNFSAKRRAATNAGNFGLLERRKGGIKTAWRFLKKKERATETFFVSKRARGADASEVRQKSDMLRLYIRKRECGSRFDFASKRA